MLPTIERPPWRPPTVGVIRRGSDQSSDCKSNGSFGLCSSASTAPWMRVDGVDDASAGGARPADEQIAVGAGEHAEPAAQLVGAVAAQLAPVSLLERLAPAAALAEALDAGVELGDLDGLAFGQRRGGVLDAAPAGRRPRP